MNKTITFLLITITTLSYSMKIEFVTPLTPKLNAIHDEKKAQSLIRHMAHEEDANDHIITWSLVPCTSNQLFKKIGKKIHRLFDIVYDSTRQFTQEDLSDPWYVNVTSYKYVDQYYKEHIDRTLLSEAYNTEQIQKIKDLINAGADVKHPINNKLLILIASRNMKNNPAMYLTIAELLLKKGANVNIRDYGITPLYEAVKQQDKEYVHLLLWYNADPEIVIATTYCGNSGRYFIYDAFQIEQTGWLKKMVDEKQEIIFKCLLFKHHNLETSTLLSEIIELIRYKVWEISKNPFKTTHSPIDQCIKK